MNYLLALALFAATACVATDPDATSEPRSPATEAGETTAAQTAQQDWRHGISEQDKERANAAFAEGNELFAQGYHVQAAKRYRVGVAIWDHPLIQFNLAVTLIRLEQYPEASQALTRALRFGEAPFSPEHYTSALDHQKLLVAKTQTQPSP